jgi:protein-tyrosine sulfotransferase
MALGSTHPGNAAIEVEEALPRASLWHHLANFARFAQTERLARRLIGLPDLGPEDFDVPLGSHEAARLAAVANRVRGKNHCPAIFVNGVMPRSGTNFIANALALHPAIAAFPRRMYEFPLLEIGPGARALRHEWLAHYPENGSLVETHELFAYLASGWLADLQTEAPDRHLLFKNPHVRQLGLFRAALPNDRLVLCLRDGRDVVASTLASFQHHSRFTRKSFGQLVHEWRLATEAALAFAAGGPREHPHITVVRFEDMIVDQAAETRRLLGAIGLDADAYPFDRLAELPVFGSSTAQATGQWRWQRRTRDAAFKPVGRFADWSERRKRAFDNLAGETLRRAGYS